MRCAYLVRHEFPVVSETLSYFSPNYTYIFLYRYMTYLLQYVASGDSAKGTREWKRDSCPRGREEWQISRARNNKGEDEEEREREKEVGSGKTTIAMWKALSHVADRTTWAFRPRHRPIDRPTDRQTDRPTSRSNERTDTPSSVLIEGGHGRFHGDVSFTCTCTPCRAHAWYTFPAVYIPSRRCARCNLSETRDGVVSFLSTPSTSSSFSALLRLSRGLRTGGRRRKRNALDIEIRRDTHVILEEHALLRLLLLSNERNCLSSKIEVTQVNKVLLYLSFETPFYVNQKLLNNYIFCIIYWNIFKSIFHSLVIGMK